LHITNKKYSGERIMKKIASLVAVATLSMASASAFAASADCPLSWQQAQDALNTAVSTTGTAIADGGTVDAGGATASGQFDLDMWIAVVNRDGAVCAVAKANGILGGGEGATPGTADPWPGSRVIAAQKANTANSYSNTINAFTTANLWNAVQPGGSLYGLQESNPVNPAVSFRGDSAAYGTATDPMNGLKVGGVNVFGGGLAIYNAGGDVIGAIGVSGDTSCADHNIAWRTLTALNGEGANSLFVDSVKSKAMIGVADGGIVYDTTNPYGHPNCSFTAIGSGLGNIGNSEALAVTLGAGVDP
jgi:uncharacterized protein GlcG (DUF336 family)